MCNTLTRFVVCQTRFIKNCTWRVSFSSTWLFWKRDLHTQTSMPWRMNHHVWWSLLGDFPILWLGPYVGYGFSRCELSESRSMNNLWPFRKILRTKKLLFDIPIWKMWGPTQWKTVEGILLPRWVAFCSSTYMYSRSLNLEALAFFSEFALSLMYACISFLRTFKKIVSVCSITSWAVRDFVMGNFRARRPVSKSGTLLLMHRWNICLGSRPILFC